MYQVPENEDVSRGCGGTGKEEVKGELITAQSTKSG